MKKKPEENKTQREKIPLLIPRNLQREFRKMCIIQDLKPYEVVEKILSSWIEKEKKRNSLSKASNG